MLLRVLLLPALVMTGVCICCVRVGSGAYERYISDRAQIAELRARKSRR